MTVISAIVDRGKSVVWMGGDSAATAGYDLSLVPDTKVFYHTENNFIIGCCGSARATDIIHYKFKPPEPETDNLKEYMVIGFTEALRHSLKEGGHAVKSDETEYTGVQLMVGFMARLFVIDTDYQVREVVTGYDSIGAGSDLANGALYATRGQTARKRIQLSLEAASTHNTACRPPFSILRARWKL